MLLGQVAVEIWEVLHRKVTHPIERRRTLLAVAEFSGADDYQMVDRNIRRPYSVQFHPQALRRPDVDGPPLVLLERMHRGKYRAWPNVRYKLGETLREIVVTGRAEVARSPGPVRISPWQLPDRGPKTASHRGFGHIQVDDDLASRRLLGTKKVDLSHGICGVED